MSGKDEMRSDTDHWFAEDKLEHFFLSFAATSFVFSTARSTGLDRTPALATAATSAAVAGVGKEWYDRQVGRPFSYKDLGWDALGIVAGVLLLASVD